MPINKFLLVLLLILFIAACSGGGGYCGSYCGSSARAGYTYSISGTATLSGKPLLGAMFSLTGTRSTSTTTDSYVKYSFTGPANGSYTVKSSEFGYAYIPASAVVNISCANVTDKNFAA